MTQRNDHPPRGLKAATPFRLADARGGEYRLSDFQGRYLLLVFHRHLA